MRAHELQGLAEDQLNELDMFAPVTTFIKMTDGSYVQADWRRGQGNAGFSDSASFINFKPVNPTVAKQLGLDSHQRNNSISNHRDGTIASGGDYQGSGPMSSRRYEVVDYNKPETMEKLPDEIKPELIKWVQKQSVAEGFNGEYDDEAGMAHTNLHTIARAAQGLLDTIDDHENLPEWVQEKIARVEGMMVTAWDYLKSQEEQGIDPQMATEAGNANSGRRGSEHWDTTPGMVGRVEKTARGVQHHADPSRYGGSDIDTPTPATLSKASVNRLERALGIKWDREKKRGGEIKIDEFGPAATAAIQQGAGPTAVSFADLNDIQNKAYAKNAGVAEGEKIGNMDADAYDAAMARLKRLSGSGPRKTVWDPVKRVYKTVPVAQQPVKK